ncbi:Calx-beta domain-containing protein [Nocardioides sp. MH1]|uniref:Calx-beta domain-containing protein n=1 Tax=Nocardioides sp. MH1 TaxID=3242490 RepID=UPI003520D78F
MKSRLTAVVTTVLAPPLLMVVASAPPAHAGPPASSEVHVSTSTSLDQSAVSVASDPAGNTVAVWRSELQDGSIAGVYAQRYGADGTALGSETQVNVTTAGDQSEPDVAMDASGDYVVTWTSDGQDGSGTGIYARRFAADGTPIGGEFRVNSTTAGAQTSPKVAMDAAGDFVVTFTSDGQDGNLTGVYARRYNASGTALGSATLVNQTTSGNQEDADVAMDAAGNYAIAWTGKGSDASLGVWARRYDATGVAQANETKVSSGGGLYQVNPAVAMAPGGDHVVVWDSYSQDGDSDGIYGQRFNAGGSPVGSETRISSTITGSQYAPTVAMDASGDYLVGWTSVPQDGSGDGIFFRRFTAAGASIAGETRANATTHGDQANPAAALDADGDAFVAWASDGQDGSLRGVYGRRFRGPDPVDLQLDQVDGTGPRPVLGQVTYRIRVTNLEDASTDTGVAAIDAAVGEATGVHVISQVPDGATYASSSGVGWTCTPAATTVTCRLAGVLAAGRTAPRLALTYTLGEAAGTIQHQARVYEDQLDTDAANNGETATTDVQCTFQLSQAGILTPEAGAATLEVDRTGSDCGAGGVSLETVDGTAVAGADFDETGGELLFDPTDVFRQFEVPIRADAIDESNEQLRVRLSDPTGGLLGRPSVEVVTITDDDAAPRINFTTASGTGAEPSALVDVTLRLSAVSGQAVTVSLTRSGTATSGADYYAPTKVDIPAGQRSADFTIEVTDDAVPEVEEIAKLTLAAPTNVVLGSLKTYQLTITSNE